MAAFESLIDANKADDGSKKDSCIIGADSDIGRIDMVHQAIHERGQQCPLAMPGLALLNDTAYGNLTTRSCYLKYCFLAQRWTRHCYSLSLSFAT